MEILTTGEINKIQSRLQTLNVPEADRQRIINDVDDYKRLKPFRDMAREKHPEHIEKLQKEKKQLNRLGGTFLDKIKRMECATGSAVDVIDSAIRECLAKADEKIQGIYDQYGSGTLPGAKPSGILPKKSDRIEITDAHLEDLVQEIKNSIVTSTKTELERAKHIAKIFEDAGIYTDRSIPVYTDRIKKPLMR